MAQKTINKLLAGIALLGGLAAATVNAANIDTNMARMQAMDKITGRVSEIDVPVNGEAQFGSFSIVVRKCVTRTPEETPENTAFVDVVDNYNPENVVNIFKGWMMSSTPALNAVEHPIYDVWLLKCYDGNLKGKKLLSKEELALRDEVPMQQPETKPEIEPESETAAAPVAEETVPTAEQSAEETAVEPQSQPEVVSVVVSTPDEAEAEDGAPRALLQVESASAEPAPAPAPEAVVAPQAETPEEDGFISFEDDEEDEDSNLSAEALVGE